MKGRSLYPAAVVIGVGAALIGTAEVATADIGTDAEVANAGVSHSAAVSAGPRKSTGRAFRVATVAEAPPARRGRVVRPSARSAATVVVARAASQSARATGTARVNPIAAFLFNKTPTLAPVTIGQDSAGVVTGDLGAADSDGGTVSFVVTRGPVNGTVVVDTTGRYTYTPDPEYAQAGTTDSFTVAVSDADAGFHLHGLVGLLNLLSFGLIGQSGHSATATVPVVVYPTGPPPNPPSVERRVYATATDSTITVTPESGEAAHVIINPSPIVAPKGQLVVFLPGTQGVPEQYTLILRAAAGWGFHAIGLNYPNQTAVGALCGNSSDADCFWNARTEILFGDGTPVNGQADITMADSIVNRLDKLLLSMNATHPAEGWGQFLLADNTVDWGKVVLAGHSQGGGHVGVMAKTVSLGRAVYFSSPADWNNLTDQPADWTVSRPTATPASRQYGFGSDSDPLVPNEKAFAIWDNLGLAEPATGPVLVDTASDAYSGSHQLRTALTYNPASTAPGTALKNHGITVVDVSTPVDGSGRPVFGTNGVWAYLLG